MNQVDSASSMCFWLGSLHHHLVFCDFLWNTDYNHWLTSFHLDHFLLTKFPLYKLDQVETQGLE